MWRLSLTPSVGGVECAIQGRSASLQAMLVTPHAFTAQMREWLVLTLLRLGRTSEGHQVLAQLSDEVRQWGEARTALAVVCLADGDAQAADEALDLVLNGSAPVLHSGALAGMTVRHRAGQALPLHEELSDSELRVLGYLSSNLSAPAAGSAGLIDRQMGSVERGFERDQNGLAE